MFFLTINPFTFIRMGHFTILNSFLFFPLIITFLYYYLKYKKPIYLCLLFISFHFGNSAPQAIVVNTSTLLIFPILFYLIIKERYFNFVKSYFLIILIILVSLAHIIFPVTIGMGSSKSIFESIINLNTLKSLSRNSNFFTSVSGTNYYYDMLITYPHFLSIGFLIFCVGLLICIVTYRHFHKLSFVSVFFLTVYLIINGGYSTYPNIFEFLIGLPIISEFLWVIKDPNMYYQYFLYFLVLIICLQSKLIENKRLVILFSIFLLFGNFFYNYFSNVKNYKSFFQFIPKPAEYNEFVEFTRNSDYRNLWVPYNTYNAKTYSHSITYFPSPALWVTENRELTNQTLDYANLISILENEIFTKKCINKTYISWLIKTNRLNIVIDKMTKNYLWIPGDDSENKIEFATECLNSIDSIELFYTSKYLESYISSLYVNNTIYKLTGDNDYLISFIESSPANIIYEETMNASFSSEKINESFYILNESYDENWLVGFVSLIVLSFFSVFFLYLLIFVLTLSLIFSFFSILNEPSYSFLKNFYLKFLASFGIIGVHLSYGSAFLRGLLTKNLER